MIAVRVGRLLAGSVRGVVVGGVVLVVLAGGLVFGSARVLALPDYRVLQQVGGLGKIEPAGVGVNDATGDVYVADRAAGAGVEELGPGGEPLGSFDVNEEPLGKPKLVAVDNACYLQGKSAGACGAFDPSAGDVYVGRLRREAVVAVFEADGKYTGRELTGTPTGPGGAEVPFERLEGIAVDPAGNIWVYEFNEEAEEGVVDEFSDTGAFLGQFFTKQPAEEGIAVSASDDVYIVASGTVKEFIGGFVLGWHEKVGASFAGVSASALAVAEPSGNLLVDDGQTLGAYGSSGALLGEFGGFPAGVFSEGVAVDDAGGMIYVSLPETIGFFEVFHAAAPVIGGVSVSGVTQFAATLHAMLDPENAPAAYHFVYVEEALYRSGAARPYEAAEAGHGGGVIPVPELHLFGGVGSQAVVPQAITGLRPGTTYHFALLASGPGGSVEGTGATFTTPPIPTPLVNTGAPSGVSEGAATLTGAVDPQGWETTYTFQYGTTSAYGQEWPTVPVTLGALESEQSVLVHLEGLQPATTYHYRLVASNAAGTIEGSDDTFTTGSYPVSIVQETPTLTTSLGITPAPLKSAKPHSKAKKKKRRKGAKPKQKHKAAGAPKGTKRK